MEKLILVVSQHRRFGWKFNIYWARENQNEEMHILGTPHVDEEALQGASEIDRKLIKLIDEVSDTALMKAYSKQKNLLAFMEEVTQKTIDNLIHPRIELNNRRVVNLALQSSLPVYFRERPSVKILDPRNLISILVDTSHCVFNFVKDEKGLRYFISLTNDYREVSLQQKPAFVLSHEPCIILLRNEIHRVDNIDSKKLMPFFDKAFIAVPPATEKTYIKSFILKTIPRYEVKIEGLEMTELHPERQAVLVLEEDFFQQMTLFLYFHYNHHKINPALRKIKFVELLDIEGNEKICWFVRDMNWEKQLIDKLFDLGLRLEGENRFYLKQNPEVLQQYGLIGWLNINRKNLSEFAIEQKVIATYYTGTVALQSKLDVKIDWFDIEIEVVFENVKIPFSKFGKHILNGNVEFVLPDKTIFILPEEWFHRYNNLFLHGKETDKGVRIHKMHIGLLDESVNTLFTEKAQQGLVKIKQLPSELPEPPVRLNVTLRPYQREGFNWLCHLDNIGLGGCLADDMGLGKTLQTILLLDYVYARSGQKPATANAYRSLFDMWESNLPASLVVVPKSLMHNWQNELKKFAPELRVYMYAGNNRIRTKDVEKRFNPYQVVIISYSLLRNDIETIRAYPFHYLVLDESQYIKNPDSIIYQSIQKLSSSHKLILTGTPIENSLSDLWAQFNFINPGLLGSLSFFKNHYIQKIKEKDSRTEEALQKLIQPFFLRRTKEAVAVDLPPLAQEIVYCDMTESQQEIYESEKTRIRNVLLENKERFIRNSFVVLQGLLRLRLIANHPALFDVGYREDSGKFDQIILYYESLKAGGHKVLIFSSFVKHLKLLAEKFDRERWKYAMLTGQTVNREDEIKKFTVNNDVNCFFISLKAGGVGLNLTAADYVFIIDPWWNPAAEMQALSRAHRIGQDKHVIVYRFISSETIEEKIILLQQAKLQLSETFITSNNPLENLNSQEITELLM